MGDKSFDKQAQDVSGQAQDQRPAPSGIELTLLVDANRRIAHLALTYESDEALQELIQSLGSLGIRARVGEYAPNTLTTPGDQETAGLYIRPEEFITAATKLGYQGLAARVQGMRTYSVLYKSHRGAVAYERRDAAPPTALGQLFQGRNIRRSQLQQFYQAQEYKGLWHFGPISEAIIYRILNDEDQGERAT